MRKICNFLDRISDIVNAAARKILLVCGAGILFAMTCGIFSRSLLPKSFIWPEEVARYLLIWACFVGASVALHNQDLIRFEFVINLFKGKAYTAVELLGNVLSLVFLVFFIKIGVGLIPYYMKAMGTTVPIKMIWPAMGVYFGGVFMLIHMISFTAHSINKLMGGEPAGKASDREVK